MDRKFGFRWSLIFIICKLTTFAYLDCSIFLICCSGWVWESFPTNKVSVAILSRLGYFGFRLTGLICLQMLLTIIGVFRNLTLLTTDIFYCIKLQCHCVCVCACVRACVRVCLSVCLSVPPFFRHNRGTATKYGTHKIMLIDLGIIQT